MAAEEPDIKSEFADEIGLNLISRFFHTIAWLLKDPRAVMESVMSRESRFIKPLKFALSIAAPIFLVFAILKPDFSSYAISAMQELSSHDGGFGQALIKFISKIFAEFYVVVYGEYLPLINVVVIAPIMALVFKVFYKNETRSFYYPYSVALYITGLTSLVNLTFALMKYFFDWRPGLVDPEILIDIGISVYLIHKIYSAKTIVKPSLAYVTYNAVILGLFIIAITVVAFLRFDNFSYKPIQAIGIITFEIDSKIISQFQLKRNKGLVVQYVQPGSPAEGAGIRPGDIILKAGQKTIRGYRDFQLGMDTASVAWPFEILRDEETKIIQVHPQPFDNVFPESSFQFGWSVELQYEGDKNAADTNRMVLTRVQKGHAAEKAGLLPGDQVVSCNGFNAETAQNRHYLNNYYYSKIKPGDTLRLQVLRQSQPRVFSLVAESEEVKPKPLFERIFLFHH